MHVSRQFLVVLILVLILCGGTAAVVGRAAPVSTSREAMVVVSLTANEDYQRKCEEWAGELTRDLATRWGFLPSDISLAGPETVPGIPQGVIRIAATRVEIEGALKKYAASAQREGDLFVFVFGSGTFDGKEYKLNLKGPDLSGTQLKSLLDEVPRRLQVLLWGTSCSGELLKLMASKNRVVMTATRSGTERNDPRFPGFFLESLQSMGSDTDKDSRISWLEAFQAAKDKTEESYKAQGHLATEHPVFDDDGDGEWHPIKDDGKGDGLIASATYFDAGGPAALRSKQNPALQALMQERDQLEASVRGLRSRKSEMPAQEYDLKLEELLLKLARISSEVRKLEAVPAKPDLPIRPQ